MVQVLYQPNGYRASRLKPFVFSPDVPFSVHAHAQPSELPGDILVRLVLEAIHHMDVARHRSIFSVTSVIKVPQML